MTGYATIGRTEFEAAISPHMTLDKLESVMAAYSFSKGAHREQIRADGVTRYFEHCKSVAWILIEAGLVKDWEILVIALLHDGLEDSHLFTRRRIELNFGVTVRQGIEDLSKRTGEPHAEYVNRLMRSAVDWRTLLTKLADRLQNLRTLGACSPEKQIRKRTETRELYLPQFEAIQFRMPTPATRLVASGLSNQIIDLCQE